MQLFAIKLVSFKNTCIFNIVIFYVLLATSWFVITTIPVLLSVLLPKVPRSIEGRNVGNWAQFPPPAARWRWAPEALFLR